VFVKAVVLLALTLLVSGCLDAETYEVRILREQGDPAVVTFEYANIYSDATTAMGARDDFDELVKLWQGEKVLQEMKDGGILVKSRELFIRDGKIIGRLTGIASNLGAVEDISMDGSQIRYKADKDWVIVETNGRALKTSEGEAFAAWPKETTDMRVTFRNSDSKESSRSGQAAILKLFQDYQASRK
jgi:hypothetical protein